MFWNVVTGLPEHCEFIVNDDTVGATNLKNTINS
jgi:hypothetical protein